MDERGTRKREKKERERGSKREKDRGIHTSSSSIFVLVVGGASLNLI